MIKIAETNEFFKESFKKEKNGVMRAARFNSLASNVISFLSQSLWLFMSLSRGKRPLTNYSVTIGKILTFVQNFYVC